MDEVESQQIDRLIEAVLASSKYKRIDVDFIKHIGMQELARHRNLKGAIKSTKNKLHQIGGAYQTSTPRYSVWLDELKFAKRSGNEEHFHETCKWIMQYHASTRERLPILEQFYTTIFADLPPIHRILDVACGFNPLTLPWMPLAESVEYYAYDIYQDMLVFLERFMALIQVQGQAQVCDIIQSCPTTEVDVAFVLKALPCLEQVDKSAGSELLHRINAKYVVVSFPVHSLGGRMKGMEANYEARFWALVEGTKWEIKRFDFATELVFLIKK